MKGDIEQTPGLVGLSRYRHLEVHWNLDRFNEVAGDRPNLFVKWRVRYIENLDITNLRGNDQNVRYIEVIVFLRVYGPRLRLGP